jgi:hypothetical protein
MNVMQDLPIVKEKFPIQGPGREIGPPSFFQLPQSECSSPGQQRAASNDIVIWHEQSGSRLFETCTDALKVFKLAAPCLSRPKGFLSGKDTKKQGKIYRLDFTG